MLRYVHSLSFRIFLLVVLVVSAVLVCYIYLLQVQERSVFRELLGNCAERTASLLSQSMRHAMLANRKDQIESTVQDVSRHRAIYGIRIFNKSGVIVYSSNPKEIGHQVDVKAEACIACHGKSGQATIPRGRDRIRSFRAPDGRHILGMTVSIDNEPACYNGACHAHSPEQAVLGILDVRLDQTSLDLLVAKHTRQAVLAGLFAAIAAALAGGVAVRLSVHKPIRSLIHGTAEIASGNLGYTIPVQGKSEIAVLAASFNKMSADLKKATDELKEWSQKLEERVRQKTEELERAQAQMVQAERMASLGKMAASVAHELNNPMSGILGLAKYVKRRVNKLNVEAETKKDLLEDLDVIESEARRCGNIVKNLLLFAREGREEFAEVELNEILNRSLVLVSHHLELVGVKLESELCPKGCRVVGNADELKQAFLALLINAVEAMPDGGTLRVRSETLEDEQKVRVEISDTGVGIPEDVLPHIFEPFFTTKTGGEGLGLGLAVVYGIVQKHQGQIHVRSKVGEGTTFTVELPVRPASAPTGKETEEDENRVEA